MLLLLEKTNERVTLDRPFLIEEKMQVIINAEKNNDISSKTQTKSSKVNIRYET